jgi:MoaA/NifB/PqqE/SkfB family radical SAM enzyme
MPGWFKKQMDKMRSPELDWVQVEVTTCCNGSCSYCPHEAMGRGWVNRHMPLSLFKKLLPSLGNTGLVFLQGWGEPLLNGDLFDMIRLCKDQGNRVGFTTNGMLLGERTTRRLLELQPDILGVSLAGTSRETHNRIRQGTDLAEILRNLERLKAMKEKEGLELPEVHLAYLVVRSNFDDLKEIVSLAKRVGVREVVASNLSLIVDRDLADEALFNDVENRSDYQRVLEKIKKKAKEEGIHFAYNGPGQDDNSPRCGENVGRSCVISVDGDVSPCVMTDPILSRGESAPQGKPAHFFKGRAHPLLDMSFGRIGEESLTRIWNKREYREFRGLFRPGMDQAAVDLKGLPQRCLACHKRLLG